MVAAIATGASIVLPLAGKIENQKDPQRFQTAETLYYAARAGDLDALCQLKYFSGRFGVSPGCGKYGTGTSGFATNVAKQYAFDLYTLAEGIRNGEIPPSTPKPPTPAPSSALGNIPGIVSGVSSTTGQIASNLGAPNVQEQQRNTVVLLAVAGLAAFFLFKSLSR